MGRLPGCQAPVGARHEGRVGVEMLFFERVAGERKVKKLGFEQRFMGRL